MIRFYLHHSLCTTITIQYSQIARILLTLFYIPLRIENTHSDWISKITDSWNIRPRRNLRFLTMKKHC